MEINTNKINIIKELFKILSYLIILVDGLSDFSSVELEEFEFQLFPVPFDVLIYFF